MLFSLYAYASISLLVKIRTPSLKKDEKMKKMDPPSIAGQHWNIFPFILTEIFKRRKEINKDSLKDRKREREKKGEKGGGGRERGRNKA